MIWKSYLAAAPISHLEGYSSCLVKPSLHEVSLHNCANFSGQLLFEIGTQCKDLRSLYVDSLAEKRGRRAIHIYDLEKLLGGCSHLEALSLKFDVSSFLNNDNIANLWDFTDKLTSLSIGFISSVTATELFSSNLGFHWSRYVFEPNILPKLQKLCLSVDIITDDMVYTISTGLVFLTHLNLLDAPKVEASEPYDLTNSGLRHINPHGRLKHLSLIRSQQFITCHFENVTNLEYPLRAGKFASMESICLVGFCRVPDIFFKSILNSSSSLYKFKVTHAIQLTDLGFNDVSDTLTHVSFRWCEQLTNDTVLSLVSNVGLKVLDLRDCRSIGDESLQSIGTLTRLKVLLIDGFDITDAALTYLRPTVKTLYALSLRGCEKLTDDCITILFDQCGKVELRELDISKIPNISDFGVLNLAKSRIPFLELRMRQCPMIGDISIMALASMMTNEDGLCQSSLRLLDIYNCDGITKLAFHWLKKPYFPMLKWLGVTGTVNRDQVNALAKSRPFLHVACKGEEIGPGPCDISDGLYTHDYEKGDEFEEWWLLEADDADAEEIGEVV